jgi:hypothetical protein
MPQSFTTLYFSLFQARNFDGRDFYRLPFSLRNAFHSFFKH